MATDIVSKIKAELEKIEGLDPEQRDVLTSTAIIERILPVMTAIAQTQVQATQDVKDKTSEASRLLSEKILKSPGEVTDISQFLEEVTAGNFDASWVMQLVAELKDNWFFGPALGMMFASIHIATMVLSVVSVSSEKTKQAANKIIQPFLLDLDTLMSQLFRFPNQLPQIQEEMRKMGISDDKIAVYIDNSQTFLPTNILAQLLHRGEITDDDFVKGMHALKFTDDQIAIIRPATFEYPGVQDLVRFGVREVFSPELASSLGLYEGLPPDFIEEAEKAGLPNEYAQMYWAAHWQPVPLGQSFEMFHRGVIDEETLFDLIKIADYMPNFRNELVEIAYSPITRIDLRRMYEDGMVTYEELVSGYMDLGYSPENAAKISEWVDLRYGEDRKELAKTDVLRMYKIGAYDFTTTFDALRDLKYTEIAAQELIFRIDLEAAEKEKTRIIKLMKKAFTKKTLTPEQIIARLSGAGLQQKEITDLLADWDIEVKTASQDLSKADIKALLTGDIINDRITDILLKDLGYSAVDSERLIILWTTEKEAEIRLLTKQDIERLFVGNVWTEDKSSDYLINLGYSSDDVEALIQLWGQSTGA